MKVAAILIVKGTDDEAPHLKRCLESVSKHVDGVFINVNAPEGVKPSKAVLDTARAYTDNVIETVWHEHYAETRNTNLAQVPAEYDWIIWLDSDDTIDHPEKIREIAELSDKYDSIFVDYDYDHDEAGNCITTHLIARMFKNNGSHHWNPKTLIHETLVETRSAVQGSTNDFKVIHHADEARQQASFERNIHMLEKQIELEAKDPDPRTFYYLGSTYMDAGEYDQALELFSDYLQLSGWDQERSVALVKMGKIHLVQGNRSEAKKCFAWAHAEDPNSPDPKVELGSLEVELENWPKARLHLEAVEKMDKHQTTLERNPMNYTFRVYILLSEVYKNLGGKHLDKAVKYGKKALKYKKNDKKVKEYVQIIEQVNKDRKQLQEIVTRYKKLFDKGQKKKAQALLDKIPNHLADNPLIAKLKQLDKPFKWPKKSIAIMTGDTALDAWGPWSLKEGIGGSEEAIIRLAPKLVKLGYKVVVFAKPGHQTGMYDGVVWQNYWQCNLDDEFDIFVAWRAPFIFEKKIKARKSYLWMHDVMEPGEFTPDRIANFTKCILLSDYHRSLFPMIPDDKVLMSGNGIDPEPFFELDGKIERDPHKLIYASSHVRGLAYLYEIWPDVLKAVPQATLDVYYGRESYDKVHRGNPERMKWMDDMEAKAKSLKGVTDHGKASQEKIIEESFKAAVWPYPCVFPEISCISAIKAQAAGAVPVSTDFAALNETVQYGTKIHIPPTSSGVGDANKKFLEEYKTALIDMLKNPEKQEAIRKDMMPWARTKTWQLVAEGWHRDFIS